MLHMVVEKVTEMLCKKEKNLRISNTGLSFTSATQPVTVCGVLSDCWMLGRYSDGRPC